MAQQHRAQCCVQYMHVEYSGACVYRVSIVKKYFITCRSKKRERSFILRCPPYLDDFMFEFMKQRSAAWFASTYIYTGGREIDKKNSNCSDLQEQIGEVCTVQRLATKQCSCLSNMWILKLPSCVKYAYCYITGSPGSGIGDNVTDWDVSPAQSMYSKWEMGRVLYKSQVAYSRVDNTSYCVRLAFT